MASQVYFSRVYDFAASHQLHNPSWDAEKNQTVFGKCFNPNGHGHNYEMTVTVCGTPDPVTGMVIDLVQFDACVQANILDYVDHKNLNLDVAFLANINPTTEALVRVFFDELSPHIPMPARLFRIQLKESKNNMATAYELDGVLPAV